MVNASNKKQQEIKYLSTKKKIQQNMSQDKVS